MKRFEWAMVVILILMFFYGWIREGHTFAVGIVACSVLATGLVVVALTVTIIASWAYTRHNLKIWLCFVGAFVGCILFLMTLLALSPEAASRLAAKNEKYRTFHHPKLGLLIEGGSLANTDCKPLWSPTYGWMCEGTLPLAPDRMRELLEALPPPTPGKQSWHEFWHPQKGWLELDDPPRFDLPIAPRLEKAPPLVAEQLRKIEEQIKSGASKP